MIEPRTLIALVTVALVVLLLLLDTNRVSPGPLSSVHATHPDLQGQDSCNACHGSFLTSMSEACYACHETMAAQIDQEAGFHGQLARDTAEDCAACHSDHHGDGFALVSDRSFVVAGYEERTRYDHRGLGFRLEGDHLALGCEECHAHADVPVVPEGSNRFLGLDQTCTTCHEDTHDGAYGTDCASCHGEADPFEGIGGYAHETYSPLDGAHASTSCEDCHEPGTDHAVEALADRHGQPEAEAVFRTCADCHESQHDAPFLEAVDVLAGRLADGQTCQHCHDAAHDGFLGPAPDMAPALHAASGFPLDVPHDGVDCAACHEGFDDRSLLDDPDARSAALAAAYPGRDADSCASCHDDAHAGQFDDGPFASEGCLGCHDRDAFAPTAFGTEHHARTPFPLEGIHATAECEACHELPERSPRITDDGLVTRRFAGVPNACSACHDVPHRDVFLQGVVNVLALQGDESCEACHAAEHETFLGDNAAMDAELHAASGFQLVEPHANVLCEDCHVGFGVRAGGPRGTDDSSPFLGVFPGRGADTCEECHADPHVEQFVGGVFADATCLECHDAHAFRPPLFGFEHHDRSGYRLTGSHENVGCNACHLLSDGTPELTPAGLLTRVFTGTPTDCRGCHGNVHIDLFDRPGLPRVVDGEEGCGRCHVTTTFEERRTADFDHALWAGVELQGAHRTAACDGCHDVERTALPATHAFGPVRGEDCNACHVDSHVGQFVVDGVADCTRCHVESESFGDLVFDHQRDARFALDETHILLECSACHIPVPVPGVGEAVRYKPLGVECGDCHDPAGLQAMEAGEDPR